MDDTRKTLLVAERDEQTRGFLLANLAADGYQPLGAQSEQETRLKLRNHSPALLVLGALGEDRQALALLRAVRSGEAGGDRCLPVIVLGQQGELELLRAFEAGCDHYLPKPFSYLELRARLAACLRRAREWHAARRLQVGALVVDRDARKAVHAGQELRLTRLEFELLAQLAAQPTRVFTKPELLREVWGFRCQANTRTVDAHACRLRRKLGLAGAPHLLHNVRGVGYRLSVGSVTRPREPLATAASRNGDAA